MRARGLAVAGYLALAAADSDAAVPLLTKALALAEEIRETFVAAMATQYLGQAALFTGEHARAEALLRDAAARHQRREERYAAFC